jgi:hypothetical protein
MLLHYSYSSENDLVCECLTYGMGSLLYPSLSLSLAAILTGTSFPRGLQKPNNYKTSNAYQSSAF